MDSGSRRNDAAGGSEVQKFRESHRVNAVLRTVLQRLGFGLVTLLVISVIIFSSVSMLPGDFATAMLGQAATPETVAAMRHSVGLDRPPLERYLVWILGILRGDFGESFSSAGSLAGGHVRTVVSLVVPRLLNTLFLAGLTALIAVPLSLALGMLAALYRNSIFDRLINLVTLTSISTPEFFVAYILVLFLSVEYNIFPSLANISPDMDFLERLTRCALPISTLVLVIVAHMMRMTRAAIINLLASPYIETARLKGVAPSRIIYHHALPNAWAPIITVIAVNLAYLVVGVVVVEVVFVYPGIGQLMVNSVSARDIPVVQACALIFATTYIGLNLFADIVAIVTNPRLLHPR
jgi:peptide/nickel transport system permease protein